MIKIKICGLMREEDIGFVNKYRPDFVGFVFAGTKRRLSDEKAARLKRLLDPEIPAVGVFVNDSVEHICRLVNEGTIDMIQLHGEEDDGYLLNLKKRLDCPVIRAVRVENQHAGFGTAGEEELKKSAACRPGERAEEELAEAEAAWLLSQLDRPADYLLFDTYQAGAYGGSGKSFNRTALREALIRRKQMAPVPDIFLAGGLNSENIEAAIQEIQPFAVDISSGVETEGKKDGEKIAALIRQLRDMEETGRKDNSSRKS